MKRFLMFLFVFLLIPNIAYANDYSDYIKDYNLSAFKDELDNDTYSILEELNLTDFDYDSITSISFDNVKDIFINIITNKLKSPLNCSLSIIVFVILSSLMHSFKSDGKLKDLYSTVSALIISLLILTQISKTITICALSLGTAADFIYAIIPTFFAIIIAGGGVSTTAATNSMLLILSQGLSFVSSNIFMPVVNSYLALGICSGLKSDVNLNSLLSSIKRFITKTISFISAIFVTILSIKTSVSSRVDILGLRSIRLVVNSVVPVIGSSISEGLISIQSYSSLIKSSVGIVGIIAIALIFLPSIISVLIWRLTLSITISVSDMFNDGAVSKILNAFKDSMLLINVLLILSMLTSVISFGLLIATRTA